MIEVNLVEITVRAKTLRLLSFTQRLCVDALLRRVNAEGAEEAQRNAQLKIESFAIQIIKTHAGGSKAKIHTAGGTIALLGDDQLCDILLIFRETVALFGGLVLLLA